MKISACYITKNEAGVLDRSLKSICRQVDEIIVVDTGSTDQTREIAASYGARLYDFHWQGDFAAARNEAIRYATGEWIVFLDADESFVENDLQVRQSIEEHQEKEALAFVIVNVDVDDLVEKEIDRTFVIRAFKRKPEIRYDRRIHEYLLKQGAELDMGVVPASEVWIHHTGYTPSRSQEKAKRNLQLLLLEMKTTDKPEGLYRYLAESYDGLGNVEKAIYYAQLDIANGPRAVVYASRCYRLLLLRLSSGPDRRQVLVKAVQDFPAIPEFHAEYAEQLASELDFVQASAEMEQALETYRNYREDGESMQFNDELQEKAEQRLRLWRQIEQRMTELSITACIIARDEAAELDAWLDNAAAYADRILLADTGSVDKTAKIARDRGAMVVDVKWRNDFSAARNCLLDEVSTDWVVFLDADETFRQPGRVRPQLALLELCQPNVQGVVQPIVNIDVDADDLEISRFDAMRIWKKAATRRYVGRIHEALYEDGSPVSPLVRTEALEVLHTGYSSTRVQQKLERNLKLLYEEVQQNGEQPLLCRYLADCCYGLHEYELAVYYARQALAARMTTIAGDKELYLLLVRSLRQVERENIELLTIIQEGLERYPNDLELLGIEGKTLYQMGQKDQAKNVVHRFYELYIQQGQRPATSGILDALLLAGQFAYGSGNRIQTDTCLQMIFSRNPYHIEALIFYEQIYRAKPVEEIIGKLLPFYPTIERAYIYLADWAWQQGIVRIYRYCRQQQGRKEPIDGLCELAVDGNRKGTGILAVQLAGQYVQQLFRALLIIRGREDCRLRISGWRRMLPLSMQRILIRYYGGEETLSPLDWEAYQVGWNTIRSYTDSKIQTAYGQLVLDFSWQQVLQVADMLWSREQWQTACDLYAKIPLLSIDDPALFWYHIGTGLYYLRAEDSMVQECLDKAKAAGCTMRDISAYESWMKEDE